MRRTTFWLWLLASCAWLAFVGVGLWQRWPQVPLDMAANDPAIASAHKAAETGHIMRAVLLAVGGSAAIYILVRIGSRLIGRRSS